MKQFDSSKLKQMIFNFIVPCYLFVYYLIYCIFTALYFKGQYFDLSEASEAATYSFCAFKSWEMRFVIAASSVDLFNSIVATLAFAIPLCKTLKMANVSDREITHAMKWDVILTFIATISSVITLCMLNPKTGGWIWCFCSVDPFINSSCCFFMMRINREYAGKCYCLQQKVEQNTEMTSGNIEYTQCGKNAKSMISILCKEPGVRCCCIVFLCKLCILISMLFFVLL